MALEDEAAQEVDGLNHRVQALLAKRDAEGGLSPEDQDLLYLTLTTLDAVRQRYDADIRALLEPAIETVTQAVADVAAELGITMVFDYIAVRESGMIVYADPSTDITELVAARLSPSPDDDSHDAF